MLPTDVEVWQTQNCAVIIEPGFTGSPPLPPLVAIGTSGFLGTTELTPITSIDEWLVGYENHGAPTPEPTGEMVSLLGETLDGYRIDGAFVLGEQLPDDIALNCAVDEQNVSELQIAPSGFSDVFVAETDSGLLVVTATGFTPDEADRARELFEVVIPTIEREQEALPEEELTDLTTASEPVSFGEFLAGPATFTAAGGFTVELPQEFTTIESEKCVVLFDATYTGRSPFPPALAFGVVNFLGRNELIPLENVDEWFAQYEVEGEPVPQSTLETITLLGSELDGFGVEEAFSDRDTPEAATLSCATDENTLSDLQLFAAVHSDIFAAETDEGLLVAIANGFTAEERIQARALLDLLLPTIEATQTVSRGGVR